MPPPPPEVAQSDDNNRSLADVIGKMQKENPGPFLLRRKVYRTDSGE